MRRFTPRRSGRGTGNYEFFELSLAQGPQAIGVTGENRLVDFIGRAWLLVMELDRQLRLYRQVAEGEWEEVTAGLPPAFNEPLPEGVRRVSLAFDQSARVVVAYELNEQMFVTQWNPTLVTYVTLGPFPGVDPQLMFDAVWSYNVPDSDVLLFYLKPTREWVECRVQRDNYAVALPIHFYGEESVLDQAVRLPWRYQLHAADAAGEPKEVGGDRTALRSLLYPVLVRDDLGFGSANPVGEYVFSMYSVTQPESVGFSVGVPSASYVSALLTEEWAENPVELEVTPPEALYVFSMFSRDEAEALLELAATAPEGEYVFSMWTTSQEGRPLEFGVVMNEGSYELG